MKFSFERGARDPGSRARRGTLTTAHGVVQTPAFMPVGTRASVTGMTHQDLRELKAQMILANTYHLLLRPGPDLFRQKGGIHGFTRWPGPVLTDSGGFQIFSLSKDRVITEEGARFKSYVDQQQHLLSPERSIEMQEAIGSDVMMVLDICLPSTAGPGEILAAMERTHRWAVRSLQARTEKGGALFAIVQGGLDPALRRESAAFLTQHPFDGFAIGGLAVGDTRDERRSVIALAAEALPEDKPRYLMGVGTPPDILEAIGLGVDLFDCVIPTTLAWQGTAFTSRGRVRVSRGEYRLSDDPLDAACTCPTCTGYSRGYLHHLMKCKEPLAPRLLSFHNLHHYLDLARQAREAIDQGRYAAFARETLAALDRHAHAEGGQQSASSFRVVTTTSGQLSVRSEAAGEVMHPNIGARAEAEALYAEQSRLRERLLAGAQEGEQGPQLPEPGAGAGAGVPLVLFDVGLGAASNALAARRISESLPASARPLAIVSFENDLGALRLALEHPEGFLLDGEPGDAARALLAHGLHQSARTRWSLVQGDALAALSRYDGPPAEVIFWDPFSPRVNPGLWTVEAFRSLRRVCGPRATLYTYAASTTTRLALLLAGFAVGQGAASGSQKETTCAALDLRDLANPLGPRFLERLRRSSAKPPQGAPEDLLQVIAAMPQFAATGPARAVAPAAAGG